MALHVNFSSQSAAVASPLCAQRCLHVTLLKALF